MRVARLRHRVTIQKPVITKDGSGGVVTSWENISGIHEVWAAIEPLTGQQYFAAKQVMSEVSHRVTMRYLPGVLPTMRLLFSGRYFSIVSVINPDEKNRYLVLMVSEMVTA